MSRAPDFRRDIFALLSKYECVVEQGRGHIAVHGASGTCRFRLELISDYVIIDAGAEAEFVFEVTTDARVDRAFVLSALTKLLQWEDVAAVRRVGQGRLAEYDPYERV